MNQMQLRCGAAAVALWVAAAANAAGPAYTVKDLGTLGGTFSFAYAINNAGQIAGEANTTNDANAYGVIWANGVATALAPGALLSASAINSTGQAAGIARVEWGYYTPGFWNGAKASTLETPANNVRTVAQGLNDAGQIVGYTYGNQPFYQAALWNGATGNFSLLSQSESEARDINNLGQAVGWAAVNGTSRAAVFSGGTTTILADGGANSSFAQAINDHGQVVGVSYTASWTSVASVWNNGAQVTLSDWGMGSFATAINESGQVVGSAHTFPDNRQHAVIWQGTQVVDLNDLIDVSTLPAGWELQNATGINDNGWIVGNMTKGGAIHGFLLTPTSAAAVPEPGSALMLLAGIAGLAGWRRGRLWR